MKNTSLFGKITMLIVLLAISGITSAKVVYADARGADNSAASTNTADSSLIAWWTFDEGSGTIAYDSAGTNDGTIYGATWTTGIIEGALDFDGKDDYIRVYNDASLNFGADIDFSVGFWIKASIQDSAVISKGPEIPPHGWTGWPPGWNIQLENTLIHKAGVRFDMYDGHNGGHGVVTTGVDVFNNNWHHVFITIDRDGYAKAYLDASEKDSQNVSSIGDINISRDLLIGWRGDDWLYFDGLVDEIAIYNRVLSTEEIWEIYHNGLPGVVGLEIVGPNEVAENFRANYKAIAYYDNNSTRDVTSSALWIVEPNTVASIDENGVLTTKDVIEDQLATIVATYTGGQVTIDAEKIIHVFPICPTGTALQFDGVDDYIEIPSVLTFRGITFSAWLKIEDVGINNRRIFTIDDGVDPKYYYFDIEGTSKRTLSVAIDGVGFMDHDCPLSPNSWTHVAVTYDGTEIKIFNNGDLIKTGRIIASPRTGILYVGGVDSPNYYAQIWDGLIDEVRIYNRTLSAEEIWVSMYTRLLGDEPGLVGYWDFDEGEGQTVYDLSGNGNDGYLGSDPSATDYGDPTWVESDAPIGDCILFRADVRVIPQTLNLANHGKWVACHISLPEDYNVTDIDSNSIILENNIKAESFRANNTERFAIAIFSRVKVQTILDVGEVELRITGRLKDGTMFEGTDVIRVIDKGSGKQYN